MLTSHCNNLSTHHYYLTYHPCFDMQFCHGQTTQWYFRAVAMSSRKKQKRSSCIFLPRRVVKRIGLTKLSLATKGLITRSTSPRKLCRAVVWRWFCGFIHQCWSCRPESNLYCFLSSLLPFLPSCSHLGKHYCLGEFNFCFTGISGSCVIPSLGHSASPLIFVPAIFFPFFRFFRHFKRCFGLFIIQITSQRNVKLRKLGWNTSNSTVTTYKRATNSDAW